MLKMNKKGSVPPKSQKDTNKTAKIFTENLK